MTREPQRIVKFDKRAKAGAENKNTWSVLVVQLIRREIT